MTTATAIKERPILFSGPMVRAILEGRKTQTRRIVKLGFGGSFGRSDTPGYDWTFRGSRRGCVHGDGSGCWQDLRHEQLLKLCPYGRIGDRLWVREHCAIQQGNRVSNPHYFAEGPMPSLDDRHDAGLLKSKPSIHMPRWASRISLEITGVRVERLNEITLSDVAAEGVPPNNEAGWDSVESFRSLWESINGAGSWAANPWVWVVEFRRLEE
jgi:hypothetical protein